MRTDLTVCSGCPAAPSELAGSLAILRNPSSRSTQSPSLKWLTSSRASVSVHATLSSSSSRSTSARFSRAGVISGTVAVPLSLSQKWRKSCSRRTPLNIAWRTWKRRLLSTAAAEGAREASEFSCGSSASPSAASASAGSAGWTRPPMGGASAIAESRLYLVTAAAISAAGAAAHQQRR